MRYDKWYISSKSIYIQRKRHQKRRGQRTQAFWFRYFQRPFRCPAAGIFVFCRSDILLDRTQRHLPKVETCLWSLIAIICCYIISVTHICGTKALTTDSKQMLRAVLLRQKNKAVHTMAVYDPYFSNILLSIFYFGHHSIWIFIAATAERNDIMSIILSPSILSADFSKLG